MFPAVVFVFSLGCSKSRDQGSQPANPSGPFQSLAAVANAPSSFSAPRAGVALPDGSVAFIATVEGLTDDEITTSGQRVGVWSQAASGGAPTLIYSGDALVNPLDIDVSLDGTSLLVADPAAGVDGGGAILSVPLAGGAPTELISGNAPSSVTLGNDGRVYFSGVDPASGAPAVFTGSANSATVLYSGPPLVDPSGIALRSDGALLVADTRLFDANVNGSVTLGSEAGVVLVKDGAASIFATGFATGYPAGVALTLDESTLIVSGEGLDHSDTVYTLDMAHPAAPPGRVTDVFSSYQDASAGLKRSRNENTFIWASLAANGGTVYKIEGS